MGEIKISLDNVHSSWIFVCILGSSVLVTAWGEMGRPESNGRIGVCRLQGSLYIPHGHRSRHIGISIGFRKVSFRYLYYFSCHIESVMWLGIHHPSKIDYIIFKTELDSHFKLRTFRIIFYFLKYLFWFRFFGLGRGSLFYLRFSVIFYFDRFCFKRLGVSLGLKNVKNKKAPSNAVLEKAFKTCSRWTHRDITGLSKQTDCSERQIERWLRMRKMQGKSYHLNRFSENWWVFYDDILFPCPLYTLILIWYFSWLLFYYSNIVIYGLITVSTKTWFWDLDYCWVNYPHQVKIIFSIPISSETTSLNLLLISIIVFCF